MYQFTKELILNSAAGVSANDAANILTIDKFGTFKASEVVSCYVSPYVAPVNETVTTTVTITPDVAKVYRLVIKLKRVDSYISSFANDMSYNALDRIYEITGVSTAATLVSGIVSQITKENNLRGEKLITASASSADITLNCTDEFTRFVSVELQEVTSSGSSLTGYDSFIVKQNILSGTLTKGKVGFGTVSWITRNLRLPTIENTRYLAINQDERPVAGGQYTQYSIRIRTDRGPMGMNVVGQNVESVTDHVIYVLSTALTAFDAALVDAGIQTTNAITGVDINTPD